MKKIKFVFFLSALGFQAQAQSFGRLLIEPMLTFESGDTNTDYPAPLSDSTGSLRGSGLGARLGMHLGEILFIGFEGRFAKPQHEDSSAGYDSSLESPNYGAAKLELAAAFTAGTVLDDIESENNSWAECVSCPPQI